VDDEDRHLDQIVHRAAGRLDDALDAGKYLFRLFVLVVADHSAAAFERARHLAGDVQRVARAYGVRPQTGAGLGDIWDRQLCPGHDVLLMKTISNGFVAYHGSSRRRGSCAAKTPPIRLRRTPATRQTERSSESLRGSRISRSGFRTRGR